MDHPYFDLIIGELNKSGGDIDTLFGKNVHWGYWEKPDAASLEPKEFRRASDDLTRQLLDWLPSTATKLLDVGCGFGGTISLLNETREGLDLTGLNIDERQLAVARERVQTQAKSSNQIRFIQGDACQLPFPDGTFDVVLAVECIFHFPSRHKFFEEATRVLKPGGRLILSDFLISPPFAIFGLPLFLWFKKDAELFYGTHNSFTTLSRYRDIADTNRLQVLTERDITRNTLPTYSVLHDVAMRTGDSRKKSFINANRLLWWTSAVNACRYYVLAFQKGS